MTLHVWHNDCDWVVAESAQEARDIACDSLGERPSDYNAEDWEQWGDRRTLRVWSDADTMRCGCEDRRRQEAERIDKVHADAAKLRELLNSQLGVYRPHVVTPKLAPLFKWLANGHTEDCEVGSRKLTCGEWVKENGKGFLCTTEA